MREGLALSVNSKGRQCWGVVDLALLQAMAVPSSLFSYYNQTTAESHSGLSLFKREREKVYAEA